MGPVRPSYCSPSLAVRAVERPGHMKQEQPACWHHRAVQLLPFSSSSSLPLLGNVDEFFFILSSTCFIICCSVCCSCLCKVQRWKFVGASPVSPHHRRWKLIWSACPSAPRAMDLAEHAHLLLHNGALSKLPRRFVSVFRTPASNYARFNLGWLHVCVWMVMWAVGCVPFFGVLGRIPSFPFYRVCLDTMSKI